MQKIKKIVSTFCVLGMLTMLACTPVFAKSSSWEFVMKNRLVDGAANDEFFELAKGTVYISGVITAQKQNNNYGGSEPNPIFISLQRSRFGPDVNCGSVELGNNKRISFDKKIGAADKNSSKYYLQVYKVEKDYWTSSGSGKVYNK